jgi:ABC-type lipoprotein release transport system permease subunit
VIVLFRLALRNLWRNPRRTALTVGATVFAVGMTMLFESMAAGMHKRWIEYVVRLYPGHVEVMARGYRDHRTLDYGIRLAGDRARELDRLAGVEGWAPRVEAWALVMPDEEGALGRAGWLVGVDPERERVLSRLGGAIREGRFLDGTPERSVVLGTRLARAMGIAVGDTVILFSTDYYGSQAADRFEIVGTVEVGNPEFDGAIVLLRLDGIQRFLEYGDHMSHVAVFAERTGSSEELAAELSALFDRADYEVVNWRQLLPDLDQLLLLDDVGNRFNLAILILVAGFGLLNTVLMSVFERVREFGVMRAIGARPRTLFGVVLLEATMLAVLGVVLGVAVAVPLILWFEGSPILVTGEWAQMYEVFQLEPIIAFDLERKNLLGTPVVMFGVALIAALPPAIRASRGHPVDAIRALTT